MNDAVFKTLLVGHLDDLYGYARRLSRNRFDAEDLVHDTCERAFGRWRQLRDPAAARAWLLRIMRTIYLNARHRESLVPMLDLSDEGDHLAAATCLEPPLVDVVADRLQVAAIEAAIGRLPADAREVVLLADKWELSYPEIAQILDCPVGTVRSRLHRARLRLAAELGGGDEAQVDADSASSNGVGESAGRGASI